MITGLSLQYLPDADQRLDAIFQAFNDLLFVLDSDGTILDYKAGDMSHLYTSPEKFLRRKMQEFLAVMMQPQPQLGPGQPHPGEGLHDMGKFRGV